MLRFLTYSVLAAGLLVATATSAQTTARPTVKPTLVQLTPMPIVAPAAAGSAKEAAPGTYQLVRLTNKRTVSITTDALAEIERRRHATDEVNWLISPYAKVRIPSRRTIEAPGFQPLEPVTNAYTY